MLCTLLFKTCINKNIITQVENSYSFIRLLRVLFFSESKRHKYYFITLLDSRRYYFNNSYDHMIIVFVFTRVLISSLLSLYARSDMNFKSRRHFKLHHVCIRSVWTYPFRRLILIDGPNAAKPWRVSFVFDQTLVYTSRAPTSTDSYLIESARHDIKRRINKKIRRRFTSTPLTAAVRVSNFYSLSAATTWARTKFVKNIHQHAVKDIVPTKKIKKK